MRTFLRTTPAGAEFKNAGTQCRSLSAATLALGLIWAGSLGGCSGQSSDNSDYYAGGSSGSSDASCTDGATRACSVTIRRGGGTVACYEGTRTCTDGDWGACENGTTVTHPDYAHESNSSMRSLMSISQSAACVNNPCDPACQQFTEDPTDITLTGTGCSHDLCESGAALASTCNACVPKVCAANPACCTTAWTYACVKLVYSACAQTTAPVDLCDFGVFSDTTLSFSNGAQVEGVLGSYGNLSISTDSVYSGLIAKGNIDISSPNCNGKTISLPSGIKSDGSVSIQSSNCIFEGEITAAGGVDITTNKVNGVVKSGVNVNGQSGGAIYKDAYAKGTISSNISVSGAKYPGWTGTIDPVVLPAQTAGTAVPILTTDCTGTTNFTTYSGGALTVPGPGTYGAVSTSNGGTVTLKGQGIYYFKSFEIYGNNTKIILDLNGETISTGWEIRVCGATTLGGNGDNFKVVGAGGLVNDPNGVLLRTDLLKFYTSATSVNIGNTAYFSGILMAPNGTVYKGNMNSAPTWAQITSGTYAAPVNGAIWAKSTSLGTKNYVKSISKDDCENSVTFLPDGVCPVPNSGSSSKTVEYDYQAVCPSGYSGQWRLLTWNSSAGTGSSIVFSAKVATSSSGLDGAAYTKLGTASAASPDTQICALSGPSPSCPVYVPTALNLGNNQGQYLRLQAVLSTTSANLPVLKDWNLTYTCQVDE